MGGEIIKKGIQFPVSQKSHHKFLFIGYDTLNDIDANHELAALLEEMNALSSHMRISFFGRISSNRINEKENLDFNESLAVLSNIKNQFHLPVISNLGDWDHLEKAASVSDILMIDDYLALNRQKMESFFALKKPCVIDTSYLDTQEAKAILLLAEKFKTPISLVNDTLKTDSLDFYENHFVFLKISTLNEKIIQAANALGIKGFFILLDKENKLKIETISKIFKN